MLNDHEKEFLQSLRQNETFRGILTKFARSESLRWKKGKTSEEWAYETGRKDENEALIQLFRGNTNG